jgi:hypothetical protein
MDEAQDGGELLVYRLRQWPDLAAKHRTAAIYKALSLMSNRPLNRNWLLRHLPMKAGQVDRLLDLLIAQGAVEVVDASGFKPA